MSLSLHTSLMESVVALLILFMLGIYTTNALLSPLGKTFKLQQRSGSLHLPLLFSLHISLSLLHCLFALHSTPHFPPSLLGRASVYCRVLEPSGVCWRVCVYSVFLLLDTHQYDITSLHSCSCTTFFYSFFSLSRRCFRTVGMLAWGCLVKHYSQSKDSHRATKWTVTERSCPLVSVLQKDNCKKKKKQKKKNTV